MMKRIFFLISVFLLLFLVSSEADEIHLKNGRIIKLDSYWEDNGDIVYEKFGATMYIDQNKIKKIIKEDENEIAQRKSIEDEELESQIQKYNTNGGGVFLKNGKVVVATKTWYQDGLVYCDTKKKRLYFKPEEIKQIAVYSSKKSPPIIGSAPHRVARTPIIEVTNLGRFSSSEGGQSSSWFDRQNNVGSAAERYINGPSQQVKCEERCAAALYQCRNSFVGQPWDPAQHTPPDHICDDNHKRCVRSCGRILP